MDLKTAAQPDELTSKVELWFFRDMSDEARRKLVAMVFGTEAAEEADTHANQRMCLRNILDSIASSAASQGESSEAAILDEIEQRIHHWRVPIGDEDGDHCGLYDLIGSYNMESLVDEVCAPIDGAAPSASERQQGGEAMVALQASAARMEAGIANLTNPDASDCEPELLAYAKTTLVPAPAATRAGEWPPLPDPDGTVEIDQGPAPGGGREMTFGDAWSEPLVREYVRAVLAAQPLQAPPAAPSAEQGEAPGTSEHYDEVRATLTGLKVFVESLCSPEIYRRLGPAASHARGYTHKITNALKHLDALATQPTQAPPAAPEAEQGFAALLVRDIAADFGVDPLEVGCALHELGFGHLSVNTAVTNDMARKLREHFTQPAAPVGPPNSLLEWACWRWREEVQDRPLINIHRRTLDDVWRQVIRFAGGDPDELVGPSHDALLAAATKTGGANG